MSDTTPAKPAPAGPQPRRIMLLITEADEGVVIVQPPSGGAPRVLGGDAGAKLYAMVMDPSNPPFVTEEGVSARDVFQSLGNIVKAWGST